jgi:hypothetical protein
MELIDSIQALVKALEGGSYNAAPGALTQGSALQVEDLSTVMENVTFDDSHLKLQKMVKSESCKSTLAQFNRQLSYGIFGGSAQIEGHVGQEETSDFVRVVVPMCFYSHTRRVTLVANLVQTGDGVKAEERAAADAAKKIAGDIEFDLFRGMADFSNAGVFDGNPSTSVMPALPNMQGIDLQIRQSDNQRNARDLMFAEYGSDDTVVISAGGVMTQDHVEDASVRSALNFGNAEKLIVDPRVLSAYNKIIFAKERVILAGSPQTSTGGDLQKQWVSGGTVSVEASRFLSGKAKPAPYRPKSGLTNTGMSVSPVTTTDTAAVTAFQGWPDLSVQGDALQRAGRGPCLRSGLDDHLCGRRQGRRDDRSPVFGHGPLLQRVPHAGQRRCGLGEVHRSRGRQRRVERHLHGSRQQAAGLRDGLPPGGGHDGHEGAGAVQPPEARGDGSEPARGSLPLLHPRGLSTPQERADRQPPRLLIRS